MWTVSYTHLDVYKRQAIDRGIVVDERMHTSAPDIFAAGDCCQGNNMQSGQTQIIGLWANAGVQGRVAGRNMAGAADETDGNILHNITHFLDMDFIGLGDNRLTGDTYTYTSRNKGFYLQDVYKRQGFQPCPGTVNSHPVVLRRHPFHPGAHAECPAGG